jgi:hypothetical protein
LDRLTRREQQAHDDLKGTHGQARGAEALSDWRKEETGYAPSKNAKPKPHIHNPLFQRRPKPNAIREHADKSLIDDISAAVVADDVDDNQQNNEATRTRSFSQRAIAFLRCLLPIALPWLLPISLPRLLPIALPWLLPIALRRLLPIALAWLLPIAMRRLLAWLLPIAMRRLLPRLLPIALAWLLPWLLPVALPMALPWLLPVALPWLLPVALLLGRSWHRLGSPTGLASHLGTSLVVGGNIVMAAVAALEWNRHGWLLDGGERQG